jgi:hypothetical protein
MFEISNPCAEGRYEAGGPTLHDVTHWANGRIRIFEYSNICNEYEYMYT